jgi:phosphate transport system permease protein
VYQQGEKVAEGEAAWGEFQRRLQRVLELRRKINLLERDDIGAINYNIERLRLKQKRLQLDGEDTPSALAAIADERLQLDGEYANLQKQLLVLYEDIKRDSISVTVMGESTITLALSKVVSSWRPNQMQLLQKIRFYFHSLWNFIVDDPREANTEGGVFPAIFGTVMMVLLMSVIVTPFGVIAAVYLREYARQGLLIRIIRIAVNNLAGVPSVVYGVFGLGFFVYFLGGNIDALFYPEASPAPVFGTPGLLWSSLTLAILTLPVVIVATEEGLARIPRSLREGSLALGATKAETLWRVVLPMSSPAIMTGLILAVARAAGEVAPLMLVGVVKLAPSLPLDGNFPYMHLDRKFMHLGFHIYDVGFQSPNIEAARPLVYATSFLLVVVIVALNLSAISLRNRLREKYRALDN